MSTVPCEANVLCRISSLQTDINRLYAQQNNTNNLLEQVTTDLDTAEADIDGLEQALTECCEDDGNGEPPPVTTGFRTISTEAELEAAKIQGGTWYVTAMVQLTHTQKLDKPLELIGLSLDGGRVGFSLNYVPGGLPSAGEGGGTSRDMFRPFVGRCKFRKLSLTTNHPLTSGFNDTGACIAIYGIPKTQGGPSDPDWMADIVIEECDIYKTAVGIWRQTGTNDTIAYLKRLRIVNNYVHAWSHLGIWLVGAMSDILLDNNCVEGRDEVYNSHTTLGGQTGTLTAWGNCIYVKDFSDRAIISRNKCRNTDRHAIEVINQEGSGTQQTQIINNVCNDCFFGISCSGNESYLISGNTILRAEQIGIECVGFRYGASTAQFLVSHNSLKDILPGSPPFQPNSTQTTGISIDGVHNATLICNNQIVKVTAPPGVDAYGIQMIGWNITVTPGISNVTIRGNRFHDAGHTMVFVNGTNASGEFYNGIEIEGNTFYHSTNYLTLFPGPTSYAAFRAYFPSGTLVIRNNTSFIAKELAAGTIPVLGTFFITGTGKVFDGFAYQNPIDMANAEPGTVEIYITGTNIRVVH